MDAPGETSLGGPAIVSTVHPSPGLAAFLGGLHGRGPCRVLDFGPATPTNFQVYATFARSVHFVDLLRDARESNEGAHRQPSLTRGAVAALLPDLMGPYEAILVWNALDYLDVSESRVLVERLGKCCRPGSHLFAMVSASHTMPAIPSRFEIVDPERLAYFPVSLDTRASPELTPAQVERRIAPFHVERAFLLRHGVREYVGVL